MIVIKYKNQVKLSDLPEGSLFECNNVIAIKTQYKNVNGRCRCYRIGSGNRFWTENNDLLVHRVILRGLFDNTVKVSDPYCDECGETESFVHTMSDASKEWYTCNECGNTQITAFKREAL